jgi:hypothetical protein
MRLIAENDGCNLTAAGDRSMPLLPAAPTSASAPCKLDKPMQAIVAMAAMCDERSPHLLTLDNIAAIGCPEQMPALFVREQKND